jgi:hypothetical protein
MVLSQFLDKRTTWYMAVLAFFAFAFVLRCYQISEPSVWMDEDHQATRVIQSLGTGFFSGSSTIFASKQQQPPLGYLIEGVGVTNFGVTPFGIRVHAAFLGAVTGGVFLFLLTMIFPSGYKWYLLLLALILSFHPLLLRYSQEARPIAAGIIFGSLYLYVLLRFVFTAQYPIMSDAITAFLLLVVAQTIFMLSTGFQPIALSFCLSLSLLFYVVFKKGLRKRSFWAGVGSVVSVGLFYPVQSYINKQAGHYVNEEVQSNSIFYYIDQILSTDFPIIPFERYKWFWEVLTGLPFWPTFSVFIVLFLIVLFSRKMRNRHIFIFLSINCLIFPIIFYAIFESFVDYKILPRYILVALPVYLTTIGAMYFSVLMFYLREESKWPAKTCAMLNKYRKDRQTIFAILCLFLLVPAFIFVDKAPSALGAPKRDWAKLYSLFSDPTCSSNGDVAFAINLIPEGRWGPGFYSTRFYYLDNKLVKLVSTGSRNVNKIYGALCNGSLDNSKHIYLCFIKGSSYIRKHLRLWENNETIETMFLRGISIVRINVNDKLPNKALLEFFDPWVDKLPTTPATDHIYHLTKQIREHSSQI